MTTTPSFSGSLLRKLESSSKQSARNIKEHL
jgi:hypothetical protein